MHRDYFTWLFSLLADFTSVNGTHSHIHHVCKHKLSSHIFYQLILRNILSRSLYKDLFCFGNHKLNMLNECLIQTPISIYTHPHFCLLYNTMLFPNYTLFNFVLLYIHWSIFPFELEFLVIHYFAIGWFAVFTSH